MILRNYMFENFNKIVILFLFIFIIFLINTYYANIQRSRRLSDLSAFEKPIKPPLKSQLIHINGTIKQLGPAQTMYIINLPYRTDRRIGSIGLFQTLQFDAFIVPGFNIHSPEVISRTYLTHQGHIRLIEIACWASHIQLWLDLATSINDSWIFIFEDDIDLEMSTYEILQSLPDETWNKPDMIYLGYCGDPSGPIIYETIKGYRIHRAMNPSCTHAYAIRARTASKLIYLLSSPTRAIDDEIVRLVNEDQLLVFSIHPPLAIQQSITSSHRSDVNPVEDTLRYKIKGWFSLIHDWWQGVENIHQLKGSALARADLIKANQWRIEHENQFWKNENHQNFSHVHTN